MAPLLTELERVVEEQAALRRIATLVAAGATEGELAAAVTSEIGRLFAAQQATTLRWDGDTVRVLGGWNEDLGSTPAGRVFAFGGDTISARVVATGAPARIDSAADLQTEFGQQRWAELGYQASIGAPIVVDGSVWGIVTASRSQPDHPFPAGAEDNLRDFAALVAQAIVNAESRRAMDELVDEQSTLRDIATLVAAGRPHTEVIDAVTSQAGRLFGASTVLFVRWEGIQDEVAVLAAWDCRGAAPLEPGAHFQPGPGSATLAVLETGLASRSDDAIAAPVITGARLLGAIVARREGGETFPAGSEARLRSFADLTAQSIANDRAQEELRASRARIVRTADETRQRLERNLHDGAQQRLVALSLALRLVESKLDVDPRRARELLDGANAELALALEELREIARGIHPAILTGRGLAPALESLADRSPVPVDLQLSLSERLPEDVEAAVYYVVSESLTNVAKHAEASRASVRATYADGVAAVEVVDDGVGGADPLDGSGIRGLADRIEALGGRFVLNSWPGAGTRVFAEVAVT